MATAQEISKLTAKVAELQAAQAASATAAAERDAATAVAGSTTALWKLRIAAGDSGPEMAALVARVIDQSKIAAAKSSIATEKATELSAAQHAVDEAVLGHVSGAPPVEAQEAVEEIMAREVHEMELSHVVRPKDHVNAIDGLEPKHGPHKKRV